MHLNRCLRRLTLNPPAEQLLLQSVSHQIPGRGARLVVNRALGASLSGFRRHLPPNSATRRGRARSLSVGLVTNHAAANTLSGAMAARA
jgi:hypothetical protein